MVENQKILNSLQYANILSDKSKVLQNLALLYVFNNETDIKKYDKVISEMEVCLKEMGHFLE